MPATLLLPSPATAVSTAGTSSQRDDPVVRVRPFVGDSGTLYVLCDRRAKAYERVRSAVGAMDGLDTPVLLDLLDVPPVRTDLPRARLCVAGWLEPLDGDEQREATIDVAAVRADGDLLTVGDTSTLYRLHPAELSLTRADTTYDVDIDEFQTVDADPVYENEHEITEHLQLQHYDEVTGWALTRLDRVERLTLREVTVTGIDRYGLDIACATASGSVRRRISFPVPVTDEDSLGDALRALNQCSCDTT